MLTWGERKGTWQYLWFTAQVTQRIGDLSVLTTLCAMLFPMLCSMVCCMLCLVLWNYHRALCFS